MKHEAKSILIDFFTIGEQLKTEFLQFLPSLVSALAVLVIGAVTAFFVKWFCLFVLRLSTKALPKRLTEKPTVTKLLAPAIETLAKVMFFLVIVLTVATFFNKIGFDIASSWTQGLAKYLPNIVVAVAIIYFGWKIREVLENIFQQSLSKAQLKNSRFLGRLAAWTIFSVTLLIALEQLGVDMSFIISIVTVTVGVCIAGAALMFALGAKDIISQILSCHQFGKIVKPGERLKAAGYTGIVREIGPTVLLLETSEGLVSIPGNLLFNDVSTKLKIEE